MNSRIMYIRDTNWAPFGAVVIKVDRSHRRAHYQLSVLNPNDGIKFDRHEAQRRAMARLIDTPITVSIPKDATQHDISMAVMTDIVDSDAPSRARRFARMWIDNVTWTYLTDRVTRATRFISPDYLGNG